MVSLMHAAAKVAQALPKEMVTTAEVEVVAVVASFGLTGRAATQLLLLGSL
jgi:hypothetical protein